MTHLIKKFTTICLGLLILAVMNSIYGGNASDLFPLVFDLIFLMGFSLVGMLARFKAASLGAYLSFVVSGSVSPKISPSFINLISNQLRRTLFLGAHVIALVGVVQVMRNLQDIDAVGHGLAISLNGYFNASLLALVLPSYVDETSVSKLGSI